MTAVGTGRPTRLRLLAAGLLLVVAGIHFQQYAVLLHPVPTIGVLFLLNAAGGAALVAAILGRDRLLRRLALLGGLVLVIGALVSIALAMNGGIFGYQEPSFRVPVVLAMIAEAAAIPALGASLLAELRARRI
jgi:hypothetical protein